MIIMGNLWKTLRYLLYSWSLGTYTKIVLKGQEEVIRSNADSQYKMVLVHIKE